MAGLSSGDRPEKSANGAINRQDASSDSPVGGVSDEQTLADSEQTLADADQTSGERDQ